MGLLGGILKSVLPVAASFIPGVGPIAGAALGAALSGSGNSAKAGKLDKQARNISLGNYNQTAPLRAKAIQLAMRDQPQREDLSSLYADPGNPYSKVVPRPSPGGLGQVGQAPTVPLGPPPPPGRARIGPDGLVRQPGPRGGVFGGRPRRRPVPLGGGGFDGGALPLDLRNEQEGVL